MGFWFVISRTWPSEDLAKMLMGEEDSQHQSLLHSAPFIFACLAKALADRALVRQQVASALGQASLQPFLAHLTGQQLAWLQRHLQLTSESSHAQVTYSFDPSSKCTCLGVVSTNASCIVSALAPFCSW